MDLSFETLENGKSYLYIKNETKNSTPFYIFKDILNEYGNTIPLIDTDKNIKSWEQQ
jgi:hypothetical protein